MSDAFAGLASAAHDHSVIFRGDAEHYSTEAERIANGHRAVEKHKAALASFMRDGGAADGFKSETMHLHGSSSHGLPVELAIAFDGDILTGQQCWDMVLHWRNMSPAPWPGNGIVAGSQGDALASVFRHWRTEAEHDFRASRDAVNSQVALAGRFCSGSHFIQLSRAVESATGGMLDKARALPIAPDAFHLVKANAAALFDALALEISPNAIDPGGRYRDCHTNGVAENCIVEARQRAMAVVETWILASRVTDLTQQKRARRQLVDIQSWIAKCGEQNGKKAWTKFRAEFGVTSPKQIEFKDAWRIASGNRGRGRPLNSFKN